MVGWGGLPWSIPPWPTLCRVSNAPFHSAPTILKRQKVAEVCGWWNGGVFLSSPPHSLISHVLLSYTCFYKVIAVGCHAKSGHCTPVGGQEASEMWVGQVLVPPWLYKTETVHVRLECKNLALTWWQTLHANHAISIDRSELCLVNMSSDIILDWCFFLMCPQIQWKLVRNLYSQRWMLLGG